jgi:filamentous hemagglutinin family protein
VKNFNTFALKPIPAVALGLLPLGAWAAPMGAEVIAGQASIQQQGLNTLVQQSSQSAVVNWQQFNVGGQELVRFQQPNSASVILNRIVGGSPSEILGQLQANGRVFITNPNGVVFGRSAQVDVGSLAVSTANISTADFMAGNYVFVGSNPQASIVNQGVIHSQSGGFAILNAPQVENTGLIQAQLGDVVLAGASGMALDLDGSGLVNFSLSGAPAEALVSARNSGALQAGTVQITAQAAQQIAQSVVNNSGTVRAQSIEQRGGEIYLTGGHIQQTGTLDASGATQGGTVRSIATGTLESRGTTNVRGGQSGGLVEVSGHQTLVLQENLEIGRGGRLLIDPANLTLVEGPNQGAADTVYEEDVENQLRTGTSVQLVASDSITVNDLSDGAIDGSAGGSGGSLLLGIGSVDMAGNFVNGTGIGNGNITFLDTNDTVLLDGRFQASAGTVSGNLTLGGVNADGGIVLNGAGNVVFDNLISSNNFNEIFINSFNGLVQGQSVDSNAGITSFSVAGLNIANINVQGSVNLFGDGGNVQVNNLQQSSQGTGSLELNISSNALVDLGSYTYNQGVDALSAIISGGNGVSIGSFVADTQGKPDIDSSLSAIISGGNGVSIGSFVADTQGKPDIDSSQRLILNGIFATRLRVNAGNGDVNIGTLNLRTNLNNEQTSNFYSGQNPGTFIDEFGQGAGIQTELIANSGSINVSNYIASAHGENRLFVNSNLRGGALSSINFGNANLSSQRSTYRVSQIDSSGNIIDTHETQMGLAQVSLGYAHTITTGNGGGLVINANQANVDIRGGVINLNSNGSKTPLSISPLSNPDQYNYIIGNNLQPTASVTAMGSAQVNLVADATGAEPQILIGADSSSQGLVVEGRQTEVNLRANHIQINGDIELTALGVSANGDFSNTPGFDRSQLGNNNLLIENGSFLLGSNRLIMTGPTGGGPANQVNLPINLTANAVGSNEVIIESNNVGSLFSNAANYNLNAAQGFRAGLFSQIDVNNQYRIERTFLDTNGAGSGSTFSSNELRVLNPNSLGAVNFGEVLLLGGRNTLEVSSLSPVFFNGGVTLTDGGTVNNLSEQAVFLPIQGAPSRPNATTNIVGGINTFTINYDPTDTTIPSVPVGFIGDVNININGTGDAIVAINGQDPVNSLIRGAFNVSALEGSYVTNDPNRLAAPVNINTGRVIFHQPGSGLIGSVNINATNGLAIGGNIFAAGTINLSNTGLGGLTNVIFGDLLTQEDPLTGSGAFFVNAPATDLSLGNVTLGSSLGLTLAQQGASVFNSGSLTIEDASTLGVRFNALSNNNGRTTFAFDNLQINTTGDFIASDTNLSSNSLLIRANNISVSNSSFDSTGGSINLAGTSLISNISLDNATVNAGVNAFSASALGIFNANNFTLNSGNQTLTAGTLNLSTVSLAATGSQSLNSTGGINIDDSNLDASTAIGITSGSGLLLLTNSSVAGSNINISGVSSSLINTSLTASELGVAVSGQQGLSLSNVEVTGSDHRLSSSAGAIQVVSSDIQGNGLTVEGDGIVTLEESVITTDNQSYTSRTTNAANAQSGSVRFLNNTSLAGDRLVVSGGLGVQLDQASLEFNSASFSSPSQASFTTSTVSANTLALNFAGLVALDAVTFNTNDAFTLAGTQVDWSNTLLNGTPSLVLNAAGISFSGSSSAGFASTQITGLQSFNNSGEALALGSANQALTLNVEGALNLGNAVLTGSSINLNGSNVVLDGNAFNTRVLNLNGSNSVSVSNVTYDLDRFTVAAPSFTASNFVLTHAQALTLQNNVINLNNVTVNAPSLTLSGSSVRFANSRFVPLVSRAALGLKADGYDVDMQASMDLDLSGSQLQGQNIRLRSGQSVLLQGSTVTAGGQLLINASREINGNGQAISNLSAEGLTFSATDILLGNTRLNIGNGQALLGNDASSLAELAEEAPNLLPLVSSPNGALVASNRLVLGSVAGNMDYLYLSAVDTGFAQAITGSSDLFIHVVPGNNEAIVVDNLDVFASATTVLIGSQGYTGNILIDANANKVVAGATDTNFVFLSQGSTVGESSISTNGQVLVLNRAPVQIEPTPEQIMALNSAPIYDRSQYQSSDERSKIEDQRQEEETDRREESSNAQVGGINEESSGRIESQTSARVAQQCYAQ